MLKPAAVFVFTLLLAGCYALEDVEPRSLRVESDTEWSGYISGKAGASVDGRGDESLDVEEYGTVCWSFQKQTSGGYLRAYMNVPSISAPDKKGYAYTSAAYGLVSGCS